MSGFSSVSPISILSPALRAVAADAVASALASEFPLDALLGRELSRVVSVINSVVKRSGHVIERSLAETLEANGFTVYRSVAMAVTQAAENIVASNPADILKTVRIKADSDAKRSVFIDLLVIDDRRKTAMIYELKRGNGMTEQRKRGPIETNLRCCTLQLESFVRQLGHHIDQVGFKVIDFYGSSGFDASISVTRDELDGHFNAPITATIEAALGVMNTELGAALPKLLAGILAAHQADGEVEADRVDDLVEDLNAASLLSTDNSERTKITAPTLIIDPRYVGALDLAAMPLAKLLGSSPAQASQSKVGRPRTVARH